MGFNFFKRKPVEPEIIEKVVEKIVEKEVKIPSRFTFAYDDIALLTYRLTLNHTTKFSEVQSNVAFIYGSIVDSDGECTLYPVFIMPKVLPTTRLVTPKKIICIGTISVNETNEILSIVNDYTGLSLEEIITDYAHNISLPTEETEVYITDKKDIMTADVIEGEITYDIFAHAISVDEMIELITND